MSPDDRGFKSLPPNIWFAAHRELLGSIQLQVDTYLWSCHRLQTPFSISKSQARSGGHGLGSPGAHRPPLLAKISRILKPWGLSAFHEQESTSKLKKKKENPHKSGSKQSNCNLKSCRAIQTTVPQLKLSQSCRQRDYKLASDLTPFGALQSVPHLGPSCRYWLSSLSLPSISCCRQGGEGRRAASAALHTWEPPIPSPAGPLAALRVLTRTTLLCQGALVEVEISFLSQSLAEYTTFLHYLLIFFLIFPFFLLFLSAPPQFTLQPSFISTALAS